MQTENTALMLAFVGILGLCCQWVAWKLRLPAILFLLLAGILVGPITGVLAPDLLLGHLLFPLISMSVAVILFEGSLTLNFKEIKEVNYSVWSMVSFGAFISWLLTSFASYYLLNFSLELAFLFGSLTVVTGPTVIVPLLRAVKPKSKLANILRWEGILIDPIGALLVVLVYEFHRSNSPSHGLVVLGTILLVGFIIGISAGALVAYVMKKRLLPIYLQPFAVLTLVLAVFTLSDWIETESGLLTVTVMGMWLANAKDINIRQILHFKEHLTILLITGLFIFLAARINLADFKALGISALILFVFMQLVSRPVSVFIATIGSKLKIKEKLFLAWVAPRGIVAASISSLFAIKLIDHGIPGANLLVPLTFMVIIGTVILQSISARGVARLLSVTEREPKGFLIIGANDMARAIAEALAKYDRRVIVSDSNWDYISLVKMKGLEFYYGNPISSHAEENLDLIGIGHVLALMPDQHFNAVASMHFAKDFSDGSVFLLNKDNKSSEKHQIAEDYLGRIFLSGQATYKKLASLINQGAEIKHTKLTDNFNYEDYLEHHKNNFLLPIFYCDEKGDIIINDGAETFLPSAGHTIASLIKTL